MTKQKNTGFTLIEVMISLLIISFVVVSILNAFAHRMHSDRNNNHRNTAIILAEAKLEEYLKYPSNEMLNVYPATDTEYIVYQGGRTPSITDDDPGVKMQYRRRTQVTVDDNLARIQVIVDYGFVPENNHYPFQVLLTTQRGL